MELVLELVHGRQCLQQVQVLCMDLPQKKKYAQLVHTPQQSSAGLPQDDSPSSSLVWPVKARPVCQGMQGLLGNKNAWCHIVLY